MVVSPRIVVFALAGFVVTTAPTRVFAQLLSSDSSELVDSTLAQLPHGPRALASLLAQRNPDDFRIALHADGRVRSLYGLALLSDACISEASRSEEWYSGASQCFIRENRYLLTGGQAAGEQKLAAITSVSAGQFDGETIVAMQQFAGGRRVLNADMKLYFVGRQLISFDGQLNEPSDTWNPAQSRTGATEGDVVEQYFDPVSERSVDVVRHGYNGVLVDAATGEDLGTKVLGYPSAPVEVPSSLNAFSYPENVGSAFAPSASVSSVSETITCQDATGNGCTTPNGHTCSYCLQRLTTSGGVPIMEVNDTSSANVPICQSGTCGTSPWTSVSPPTVAGYAATAFHFMNSLAAQKSWWGSYLPSPTSSFTFFANVEDGLPAVNCGGFEGIYTSADHKLCLNEKPTGMNGATNGFVMAHEYGHYVHDTYGFAGIRSMYEGWADSNPLRWAVYQSVSLGAWPGLNYSTSFANLGNSTDDPIQHGQATSHGEYVISEVYSPSLAAMYFPAPGCTLNGSGAETGPYQCGAVISLTYWELVWNACRLGYGSCDNLQTITGASGPYGGNTSWVLANAAYAYAISQSTGTSNVTTFLQKVDDRYNYFRSVGYINASDYARVQSVLAHHCTGWANHCNDGTFHIPGSPLPNLYTRKIPTFTEAEYGILSGAASLVFDGGSSQFYLARLSTGVPNGKTKVSMTLPAGTYSLKFTARRSIPGASYEYRYDSGSWQPGTAIIGSSWAWYTAPTQLVVSSAGTHTISIGTIGVGIDVDVIVMETP